MKTCLYNYLGACKLDSVFITQLVCDIISVVVAEEKCVTFNGRTRCYWLVLNEQYYPSVQKCEEQGGHMLILENIEEWRQIVALMSLTR